MSLPGPLGEADWAPCHDQGRPGCRVPEERPAGQPGEQGWSRGPEVLLRVPGAGPEDQMVLFTRGSAGGQGQRARKSLQLALVSMLLPDVVFCWKINSANPAGPWPGAAGGGAAGALADADPVPLPASSGPFLGPKRGGGAGGGQPGRDSEGAGREPAPPPRVLLRPPPGQLSRAPAQGPAHSQTLAMGTRSLSPWP